MKMRNCFNPFVAVFAASLTLLFVPASNAADPPPEDAEKNAKEIENAARKAAATPRDNNSWLGDSLKIKTKLRGLARNPKELTEKKPETCHFAPSYSKFKVTKEIVIDNSVVVLTLSPAGNIKEETHSGKKSYTADPRSGVGLLYPANWIAPVAAEEDAECKNGIKAQEPYLVYRADVEAIDYVRYGWTFGALLVPFKYQLQSKTLSGSTSLQLYMGYKRESTSSSNGPFLSVGISSAEIPTGAGTSSNKFGFSYGIGWIFAIKKAGGMQLMLIYGQDRFGSDSGYPYETGTWVSTSIGIGF